MSYTSTIILSLVGMEVRMAVTNPPARLRDVQRGDRIFSWLIRLCAALAIVLLSGIIVLLLIYSMESIGRLGFKFIVGSEWDPVTEQFGALPFIFGTVVTS